MSRGRKRSAAAAVPAPVKKQKRGSAVLAVAAGAGVMLLASVYLASGDDGVGRLDSSKLPAVAAGLAVFVAVVILLRNTTRGQVLGCLAAIVVGGVVVYSGAAPGLGRGMVALGSKLPPNTSSCAEGQGERPADGKCVKVPDCPEGRELAWQRGTRPVCVKEGA